MNTLELAKSHPEAFAALPDPYQADDCLVFELEDGKLLAYPKQDQIFALGHWVAYYNTSAQEWVLSVGEEQMRNSEVFR